MGPAGGDESLRACDSFSWLPVSMRRAALPPAPTSVMFCLTTALEATEQRRWTKVSKLEINISFLLSTYLYQKFYHSE